MVRYCGFRWVRAGIEGLSGKRPYDHPNLSRSTSRNRRASELGVGQWWDRCEEAGRDRQGVVEAGALLAFQDAQVPTHIIAATSVGSINAADYAAHSSTLVGNAEPLVEGWSQITSPAMGIDRQCDGVEQGSPFVGCEHLDI